MNNFKTCKKCGESKLLCQFSKNRSSKDGLGSYCKSCNAEYQKQRKLKKAERQAIARKNIEDFAKNPDLSKVGIKEILNDLFERKFSGSLNKIVKININRGCLECTDDLSLLSKDMLKMIQSVVLMPFSQAKLEYVVVLDCKPFVEKPKKHDLSNVSNRKLIDEIRSRGYIGKLNHSKNINI